jgi:hypothetical protein
MIQRIQSLYLILIVILCLLLLNGSILSFTGTSGTPVRFSASGTLYDQDQKLIAQVVPVWTLTTLLAVICIISLADLLMFRNRRLQMLLTTGVIVLSVLLAGIIAWFGFRVIHDFKMIFTPGIKMVLPVLILVFAILAFIGIRNDEMLVKSYDRLR